MELTKVVNLISRLGECPVWNAHFQQLFWTDILGKKIWRYDPATENAVLYWEGEYQVGGFAFTEEQNLVLCSDKGVFLLRTRGNLKPPLTLEPCAEVALRPGEIFNDITTDPRGRILAGTHTSNQVDGLLYRLEKNEQPKILIRGIDISNGMTFSQDCRSFFHVNSGEARITRYEYNLENGEIANQRVFFQGDPADGVPDGITMDSDDCLWAAFWGAACVKRFDPSGKLILTVPVPAKQVSSVMFGGRELSDLYITSAGNDRQNPERRDGFADSGEFFGGPVYRLATPYHGRAEWLAKF